MPKDIAEGMLPELSGINQTDVQTGTRIHHAHDDDDISQSFNATGLHYSILTMQDMTCALEYIATH